MSHRKAAGVRLSGSGQDSSTDYKRRTNSSDDVNVSQTRNSPMDPWNRQELLGALQSGYECMASINLQMAEMGLENELSLLELYESGLAQGRD